MKGCKRHFFAILGICIFNLTMLICYGDFNHSLGHEVEQLERVYFRSSDFECWQVDSAADVAQTFSAKRSEENADLAKLTYLEGRSLDYALGDYTESVVFYPGQESVNLLCRPDRNPDWRDELAEFIAEGNTKISMIRLDIGAGKMSVVVEGRPVNVLTEKGHEGGYLNANSIVFIDRKLVGIPLLITRDLEAGIRREEVTAGDLGLSKG